MLVGRGALSGGVSGGVRCQGSFSGGCCSGLGRGVSSGCSCVWFGEEGVVSDGSRLSRLCSAN